ncbi:2-hydroxy-3-keto-5-methylthiopentenyl-1-phosphate phosphatase [Effusibacillus pohliae]|uniref:2-hydroxy-3-keto-5-methylthiopentenyl-1- phosphate phosphatase n=1 Tax=Effusibacillus pohliae TaxID=232270 RepID=UPI0003756593|nr:2-hydroxy-3-keto-5-methylthiopentenyl-1-phosphate phosphatase [Effusibacillus pohliae]
MSGNANKPIVVFCDFDGTITERDMIISLMEAFAPAGWEAIKDDILSQRISVQEGVGKLFSLIPSAKRRELVRYVLETARIREGFAEFVAYCEENGIALLVTSGGIDFFVEPILQPYRKLDRVYCNRADFSGETIRIVWPHGCDELCDGGCGLCKPSIVRKYPAAHFTRVVVGDSVTDLKAARLADLVIARSLLLQKCVEEGLPHESFADFSDVLESIKRLQKSLNAHEPHQEARGAGGRYEGVSV